MGLLCAGPGAPAEAKEPETPEKRDRVPSVWDQLDEATQGHLIAYSGWEPRQEQFPTTPPRKKPRLDHDQGLADQMRAWGEKQSEDGRYLECPDIFLLARARGINIRLFVYSEGLLCKFLLVDSGSFLGFLFRIFNGCAWLSLPSGHCKLHDVAEFMQAVLPDGVEPDAVTIDTSKPVAVAVLCHASFKKEAPVNLCVHWVPGWLVNEHPEADKLSKLWKSEEEDAEQAKLVEAYENMQSASDLPSVTIMEAEIALCEERLANFSKMASELWRHHGIFFRNTNADGNCGIETLLRLEKPAAESSEIDALSFKAAREELQGLWSSTTGSPAWRSLWQTFCFERAETETADKQVETGDKQVTPERPGKQNPECPFTPDPVEKQKLVQAPDPSDVVVIPGEKPKKPKPPGKARPMHERITGENYIAHWLHDKGVTYRQWLAARKESDLVVTFLGHWQHFLSLGSRF